MKIIGWVILILLLVVPSYATAGEPWDETDKLLFALDLSVTFIDYKQTLQIANNGPATGWRIYELNPALGKYPSKNWVTMYFAGSTLIQYLIADYLKPDHRKIFLITMFIVESALVKHNLSLGLKF